MRTEKPSSPVDDYKLRINNIAIEANRLHTALVADGMNNPHHADATDAALAIVGTIACTLADIACSLRQIAEKNG